MISRELLGLLDLLDPLAKMEQEGNVVKLDLLDAQEKLVLLDLQDPLERRDLPVLMELLYVFCYFDRSENTLYSSY